MDNTELTLKKLDITDLKSLIDLQDKIISGFKEDEQHFILHRTASDFLNALESDSMFVFGLYDGKQLVSQSILSLPKDDETREIPEFLSNVPNSKLAVYKAVLVDPKYRGRGLMKRMLRIREETSIINGREIAISQIAADNPASWINALKYGMQITKVGYDPDDNAKVIYLQKRLNGNDSLKINFNKTYALPLGKNIHNQIPILFNKLQKLSNEGWVGTDLQIENGDFKLIWHPLEQEKNFMLRRKQKTLREVV